MNVNTYDATPLHEEVVSFSKKSSPTRVFNDGSDLFPLWFEVAPDRFFCAGNFDDAWQTYREVPQSGVTLAKLIDAFPGGSVSDV